MHCLYSIVISSSSMWSNTYSVYAPYKQFSFSVLHTYLSFPPLMSWWIVHTCDVCNIQTKSEHEFGLSSSSDDTEKLIAIFGCLS